MGHPFNKKIVFITLCFILVGFLIHWPSPSRIWHKDRPVLEVLSNIGDWEIGNVIPMDQEILKILNLDDYLHQTYRNGHGMVSLYIGYYMTANKVGEAHSPLVCFPGQGWVISNMKKETLMVGSSPISLMTMIVTKGENKELILYWYQSVDKTASDTFGQKIQTLWHKFYNRREDNAFVRISVPVGAFGKEEALKTGVAFIKVFYPEFLEHIRNGV